MKEINSTYNIDGISLLEQLYEDFGEESIDMFLCDFPYTFKGKQRVTANKWDLPIDDNRFFELALKLLKPTGVIALTATNPFSSHLVYNHLDNYKYDWISEKDNGSNFVHVKHQPFRVHEQVLIFGKAPTTYNKNNIYMEYNPQFTEGKPYKVKRKGMTSNLATSNEYIRTNGEYEGKRYPRSVQKFNSEKGLHPTQKSTKLFKYLIKTHCPEGGLVVDICCGSGTTAEACIRTNRKYIVNDLEYKYYLTTLNRIENTYKELNKSK